MKNKSAVYRAYDRIDMDHSIRLVHLEQRLDTLLEKSREVESPLMKKIKPVIALSLKWKFDYLCKTLESPFELENDVEYWVNIVEMLTTLKRLEWFDSYDKSPDIFDPWERTANGFDLGWTTTTAGDQFEISKNIARERLEQITEMLGGPQYFADKEILDSGCGPGRYGNLFLEMNPKRIALMEQGKRLIEVLKMRFKDASTVDVFHGTCTKLEFEDESFDFVMSNGVIHHTSADLLTMLKDHARVLRRGGAMFIMLIGKKGIELKMWQFLRDFLYDIQLDEMMEEFKGRISPLRMQGIVDHMYGEYQETSREEFEQWSETIFNRIERVPGIAGLDVTPELYLDDPYFTPRFGCGQLRYICYK